ncbi:hypothetical protein TTHERM_00666120 (macronuclear) [Tetrahymena thermophila SB210]|uniref:Uncharacterized protein n=1 Tax=Tetrahymena thermophila (strain SB210) TaxID=312017 RepID=Q23TH0_TETTS|nr:hypothetical protein TTHERM_00666120 [Tetrahymena thermophila SB210]EAR99736.1 hypothetical protein TTHERM_00666120 [Tetrahymena thermophila SB210]|eukprot:XP_001019981.1 hypothetical protein TTHERM_00666120 [Tetrahymena thermophila SB210]
MSFQDFKRDYLFKDLTEITYRDKYALKCNLSEDKSQKQLEDLDNNQYYQQNLLSQSQNESNSHLFNQSQQQEEEEEHIQNNKLLEKFEQISKNNICKNITKAFFAYLLDKKNDLLTDFIMKGASQSNARKLAKNFSLSFNHNNKDLQKLIHHPKYGKALEFYLTFEAQNWLKNSKVQQMEEHLIYISFLKLCCCKTNYSNYLVSYKKSKKYFQSS